jgi:hypothetical protein
MSFAICRVALTVGAYFRTPVGIASDSGECTSLAWPLYGSGQAPCGPIRISTPKADTSQDGRRM